MRSEWREVRLSEIMDIIGGGTPNTKVKEYWDGDIPWISVKDFSNNRRFVSSTERSITQLGLHNSSTKMLEQGDLIISARGTVGQVAQLSSEMAFNQTSYGLKAKPNMITNNFLYYLLRNMRDEIRGSTHGTVFDTITRRTFDTLCAKLPPLPTQKVITDTLSCLDAKIELNNKINENLEAQAQAIFKSWFVDFEPFQDGEFVESELGLIPKGWRIGKVDDIVELHDSKRVPLSSREREGMDKIYPYYGAASLMDYVEDYIFDGINLLLGEDGTVIDNDGHPILQYVYGRFWVNNHAHVISSRSAYTVEHLYILFSTLNVRSAVTGAVQKKINQRNLKSIPIILPPQEIVTKYNTVIEPFFSQRRKLERENKVLSALRDTLLPKLMSGEIEVPID